MSPRFSPFEASLWAATAPPAPATPPLDGPAEAEICVVGAGYTGLTTALELAAEGRRVIVLEARAPGFGGSGRNAGHCTPTFTHHELPALRRMLGEPWAARLIARQTRANDRVAELVARHAIACDWVQRGFVMGALRPSQLPALAAKARDYGAVGARSRVLSREEAAAVTGSPRFLGAWLHEEAGHLHPLAYARGLARAVLAAGGRVHGATPATGFAPLASGGWRIDTPGGSVTAGRLILATGAYTVNAPAVARSFAIQRVFVAATEPLPPALAAAVLPENTSLHDGRGDIFVCKRDAAGRIVASMFPMGRRGRDPAHTREVLTARLRWLFPALPQHLAWPFLWWGELDMQPRTVPRLYRLGEGAVALTGLSGRGVPTGTMLGGILADWARGRPEAELDLRLEPLAPAPWWMRLAPQAELMRARLADNLRARRDGVPLPPFA